MPSGVMPPTASTGTPRGRTARSALMTAGDPASAGKNLRPCAPAAMAAKPSLGVKKPGSDARPAATVAAMTWVSVDGDTTNCPPAAATRWTLSTSTTVPAPMRMSSLASADNRVIDSNGSGEFSGTSRIWMPAAISASPMATTSSGRMPRRTATSGQAAKAASNRG